LWLSLIMTEQEPYPDFFLYRRLVQAKIFIDTHYAEKINVDNIADEAYCSKFHFIRLFNKIYGNTPHQYLTQVRIEQAKRLLKKDTPVADACFLVGFESVSSFKGLFKKVVGITPTAYREQHKALTEAILKQPTRYIPGCFVEKSGLVKE
jgi:AraC-like DNA-binding protein